MSKILEKLVEKWKDVLDENADKGINAISSHKKKAITAIMLENQWRHMNGQENPDLMLSEATSWAGGQTDPLGGGYYTGGVGGNAEFHKIAIPMIRRTFPELIAHDLVGVQPLTGPVGLAFALRFRAQGTYSPPTTLYGGTGSEIGYNNIDPYFSGSSTTSSGLVTSAGEALGSKAGSGVGNDIGLGVGSGTHISELALTVEKEKVEATTRKLRSRWSIEVAQDLKAMHGLDIEQEMMDVLAYEITQEIDREILANIRGACNSTYSETVSWTNSAHFDGRWEAERYRCLYNRVVRKSNIIAITTRRGPANWVVASPNLCAMLEATADFTIAPVNANVNTATMGVAKVGTLGGRFSLYRDTFATANDLVVGYKGPSEFDAGIIYLPYIQLMQSKTVFENSFNPTVGLMSRYGLIDNLFGADLYYIRVAVNNIPS